MKILLLADEESRYLWDYYRPGMLSGYEDQKAIDFAVAASCLKHTVEHDFNQMSVAEVAALAAGNASGRVQR